MWNRAIKQNQQRNNNQQLNLVSRKTMNNYTKIEEDNEPLYFLRGMFSQKKSSFRSQSSNSNLLSFLSSTTHKVVDNVPQTDVIKIEEIRHNKMERQMEQIHQLEQGYLKLKGQNKNLTTFSSYSIKNYKDSLTNHEFLEKQYHQYVQENDNKPREPLKQLFTQTKYNQNYPTNPYDSSSQPFRWSQENQLILFLLHNLEIFNRTTSEMMLHCPLQYSEEYLQMNFQRLQTDFIYSIYQFSSNPEQLNLLQNPNLRRLVHIFFQRLQTEEKESETIEKVALAKSILSNYRWKQLQINF